MKVAEAIKLISIQKKALIDNLYTSGPMLKRKAIYYGGPTNSGKTKTALDTFIKSKSGLFCGPLRMLSKEVSQKLNANSIPCSFMSSEERIMKKNASHYVCTNEFACNFHHKMFNTVIIVS